MSTTPARPRGFAALPSHARLTVLAGGGLAVAVVGARLLWGLAGVRGFVARYPGVASGATLTGTPTWVVVLHAANLFLMVLIVRSGLTIRTARRPAGHWTRRGRPLLARGRRPQTITLEQWFHVSLDVVWLVVGAVFWVLLFTSGRWVRLVPTSWDVFPNAVSVALRYLSLHWPTENGWVAYNALQMLSYFAIVFLLAPVAALTGIRMSALWPANPTLARIYPMERARAVHYPVMVLYVLFVFVHVGLVLSTGVVRNLNHMFAARDDTSPLGAIVALVFLGLLVGAWFAVRPVLLRPLATLFGKVTR